MTRRQIIGALALLAPAAFGTAVAVDARYAQTTAPGVQSGPRTRLITLGTGNPVANPDRFGPATVVLVDNVPYLVDAGEGVVRRWMAAVRQHRLGLNASDLKTAFITHLHSDHTLGYADLILTPWIMSRRGAPAALTVYGPKGLRAMTDHLLAAYAEDISIRTGAGGESAGARPPSVEVHEIDAGVALHDERVTVTAFRVPHGTWPRAFGFKFVTPDKTIVLSGDTAYSPEVAKQCGGCDILVHEGGIADDDSAYFRAFHTNADELGRLAREAKPRLLVLSHQRNANEDGVRIIRTYFQGRVIVANDLDIFD